MLILSKQLQSDVLHIEVGIHIHHGVVADLLLVLHAELSQRGIEYRGIVLGEETHVHTNLHIQGFHPSVVII